MSHFGIILVGEPVPDLDLAGVSCPDCGQDDVNWFQLGDGSDTVRCDDCGADFALAVTIDVPVISTRRADG